MYNFFSSGIFFTSLAVISCISCFFLHLYASFRFFEYSQSCNRIPPIISSAPSLVTVSRKRLLHTATIVFPLDEVKRFNINHSTAIQTTTTCQLRTIKKFLSLHSPDPHKDGIDQHCEISGDKLGYRCGHVSF